MKHIRSRRLYSRSFIQDLTANRARFGEAMFLNLDENTGSVSPILDLKLADIEGVKKVAFRPPEEGPRKDIALDLHFRSYNYLSFCTALNLPEHKLLVEWNKPENDARVYLPAMIFPNKDASKFQDTKDTEPFAVKDLDNKIKELHGM